VTVVARWPLRRVARTWHGGRLLIRLPGAWDHLWGLGTGTRTRL